MSNLTSDWTCNHCGEPSCMLGHYMGIRPSDGCYGNGPCRNAGVERDSEGREHGFYCRPGHTCKLQAVETTVDNDNIVDLNDYMNRTGTDTITTQSGIIIGYLAYVTGCHQVLLQPPLKADGTFVEGRWVDVDRVEFGPPAPNAFKPPSSGARPGSDKPAPIR